MDENAVPTDQDIMLVIWRFKLELGRRKLYTPFNLTSVKEDGVSVHFETMVLENLGGLGRLEDNAFLGKNLTCLLMNGLHLLGREHIKLSSYVHMRQSCLIN